MLKPKSSLAVIIPVLMLSSVMLPVIPPVMAQQADAETSTVEEVDPDAANLQERWTGQPKVKEPDFAFAEFQRGNYLSAFAVALPLAEAGDAAAQTLIAEIYERGLGIKKDPQQATVWYGIAAEAGNREAQFAYGLKLIQGKDVEPDVERGIAMMQKAADAGHPLANFNYATHIIKERPTGAGYRKALPYLEHAAEFQVADAYYSLSQIYKGGLADGIERPKEARSWLVKAAQAGIDTAQIDLAFEYLDGEATGKDKRTAFNWFMAAASQGNVIAQNRLAHMYRLGIGVDQSSVEAARWHILARNAGRADPEMDRFMELLDTETRDKAIALARKLPGAG